MVAQLLLFLLRLPSMIKKRRKNSNSFHKGKSVSLATILGYKKLCRKKPAFLRHCYMTFEFALLLWLNRKGIG